MEEIEVCHYGVDAYSQSGGIWDNKACKCLCRVNRHPQFTQQGYKYCVDEPGYQGDGDYQECLAAYGGDAMQVGDVCSVLADEPGEQPEPYLWDPYEDDYWDYE